MCGFFATRLWLYREFGRVNVQACSCSGTGVPVRVARGLQCNALIMNFVHPETARALWPGPAVPRGSWAVRSPRNTLERAARRTTNGESEWQAVQKRPSQAFNARVASDDYYMPPRSLAGRSFANLVQSGRRVIWVRNTVTLWRTRRDGERGHRRPGLALRPRPCLLMRGPDGGARTKAKSALRFCSRKGAPFASSMARLASA